MFGKVEVVADVGKGFGIIGVGTLGSERGGNEIRVTLVGNDNGTWVNSSSICEEDAIGVACGEGI